MKSYKMIFEIFLFFLSISTFANEVSTDDLWEGEYYSNNSELQYQWATSYLKKLNLNGHESILDIGCGDGRVTAIMAQAVPVGHVLGVDISESMLESALKLLNKIHLNNLFFAKRDAVRLDFENEFDLIVSFSCFHWIHDHLGALQAVEKGLKTGGKVFLYFAPDHGRNRFDHAIQTVMSSSKWVNYFTGYTNPFSLVTPSKFATYAEQAHLLLKRMEIITVDEVFPSKSAFAAWMTGWMSQLKQLPKELHQDFLGEIIDCYLKTQPVDAEGKVHYIDYWMEVELLKSAA